MDKTKMILDCFFKTTENLLSRNILNKDYNCIKNTGIIDKNVIYMDVGSFVKNSTLQKEDSYNHFLRYSSKYFRKWGSKNFPEMLPFFEETYKSNLKKVS